MFQSSFQYPLYKGDQVWIYKWADDFEIQSELFTDKPHQHCIFIYFFTGASVLRAQLLNCFLKENHCG